jgi:RNA polymerase sigma factor (sigma-70 family)
VAQGAARRAAAFARRRGAADLCEVEDLLQEARLALLSLLPFWQAGKGDPLPFFIVRLRARLKQYVVGRIRRRPRGRRLSWEDRPAQDLAERLAQRRFAEAEGWRASGMDGALHQALDRLSPRARRVLYLFYWRELTDEEIGSALGLGPKAARHVRYRAEAALRRALLQAGGKAPSTARER